MQPLKFESTQIFDLGRKKQEQTDLCVQFPELRIHCLVDGHGWTFQGAPAGQLLADALQKALTSETVTSQPSFATTCAAIRQALSVAHFRLRQESEFLSQEAKSCSFLGLAFNPEIPSQAICFHAGTCRLYRLREIRLGEFRLDLLTGDHVDPASREFESQLRTAVESPSAPPALTQSIGKGEELALEETLVEVREADLLLLCSDGLSAMFPDHLIARVLARRRQKSLESLAQTLIAEANAAGGKDNISVILLGSEDPLPILEAENSLPAIAVEEPPVEDPIPQKPVPARPIPSPVQAPTEELPGRVDRVAPGKSWDTDEPPSPRRRVFLPLFILLAMVSFSAWMIWGDKSKPTESATQQLAASSTEVFPAEVSSQDSATPSAPADTQPVVPQLPPPPVSPVKKEETSVLPTLAAAAREPEASEQKLANETPSPQPIEAKPIEAKPIEAKPIEAKPIEAKPIEAKPIEAKPIEAKPIEAKPIEAKPIEAKPIEAKPIEAKPSEARVELAKIVPSAAPTQTIPKPSATTSPPTAPPLPRATSPLPIDRNQTSDRANLPRERSRMERLLLDYEALLVRSGIISPSDPQLRTPEARHVTPLALEKASRDEQRELLNEVRRLERDLEEIRALDPVRRRQLRTLRERLGGRRS